MRNLGIAAVTLFSIMSGCTSNSPNATVSDNNFVKIPSGEYVLGYKDHHINPKHTVWINNFYISKTEVTNREWKLFIDQTGYTTTAEKLGNAMTFYPRSEERRVG